MKILSTVAALAFLAVSAPVFAAETAAAPATEKKTEPAKKDAAPAKKDAEPAKKDAAPATATEKTATEKTAAEKK